MRYIEYLSYDCYCGYDDNCERVYKLTGICNSGRVNPGHVAVQSVFADAVLYPNPHIVVTSKGIPNITMQGQNN